MYDKEVEVIACDPNEILSRRYSKQTAKHNVTYGMAEKHSDILRRTVKHNDTHEMAEKYNDTLGTTENT
jgi:hypothetical protein